MAQMSWFRYYSEVTRDRKIVMAARAAGVSKMEMVGAWTTILCLASDSPYRGSLYVTLQERFTVTDIETELETDTKTTEKILSALTRYEMLEVGEDGAYTVKNWSKRQFESDNSTERVRKHREKQKETPDETPEKRFSNAPDTETETDTYMQDEKADDDHPPAYDGLSRAFTDATNIPPYTGGPAKFYAALEKMSKAGVLPEDVSKAVITLRERDYTIVNIGSVVNTAINEMSRRTKPPNGNLNGKPKRNGGKSNLLAGQY